MLLKRIELEANINNNIQYSYNIKKKAKHITNYVNRVCLLSIKFQTSDIQTIVVSLDNRADTPYVVNKGLVIPMSFNKNELDRLSTDNEYRNYICCLLINALEKVKKQYCFPYIEIFKTLSDLENNNYQNEWIYKKKSNKIYNITTILVCQLLIDRFKLTLIVEKDKQKIFNDIILETDPDEIAYEYRFKDIIIENGKVIITSKNSTNLFELAW